MDVAKEVNSIAEVALTMTEVRDVMKNDCNLRYRKVWKVPIQANTERCLVLRQQYALALMPLLQIRKKVINFDESWLQDLECSSRLWVSTKLPATVTEKSVSTRIALLLALDTSGDMYFALTYANTDSSIMKLFFIRFCDLLDAKDPLWRDNAVLLLDNARYHTSDETLAVLK